MVRRSLEEQIDGLGEQIKKLELQVKTLQQAEVTTREATRKREADMFKAGVAAGIKDCVKSAYRFFPDNDWAKLGPDAALALEDAKVEDATSFEKTEAIAKEVLGGTSVGEVAATDKLKVEEAPAQEPHVVAPVEALAAALSQNAISSDSPAIDEVPKASSSLATS